MGSYIPSTKEERLEMLREINLDNFDELYSDIPDRLKFKGNFDMPDGISELELTCKVKALAKKNRLYEHIFRGAGAYNHYIPAIVKSVATKEEFITAYTPYQAEISQGVLQSIFEYQTMICELTGMDVSNASVYDGATAAAEACSMCITKSKNKVFVSAAADPKLISVVRTYCFGSGAELILVPQKDGITDIEYFKNMDNKNAACLLIQSPNYYGLIENGSKAAEMAHTVGAKFIMSCNPISLGILKTPGECGADIAVGEGQPLGLPLSFGGPYLGFMACSRKMSRNIPGRIVGQTTDSVGNRAFVLTMQAREQHIRREKAGSNICSNEALCAMTAAIYLSALGSKGLECVARKCFLNSHYLEKALSECGLRRVYEGEFFHEFVTSCPVNAGILSAKLKEKDILGGFVLSEDTMLWCATEMNTKEEIDMLAQVIKGVIHEADI